jgi:hypothetical protein
VYIEKRLVSAYRESNVGFLDRKIGFVFIPVGIVPERSRLGKYSKDGFFFII